MTRRTSISGFTLVETAIAAIIVAVMLTAAMSLSASAGLAQYKNAERATANALADAMIAEILALPYSDPVSGTAIGLDAGETSGVRSTYDDVDDYHGLAETAPAERDGTAIPGLTGWQRGVSVNFALTAAMDTASGGDTGLKRITVTVKHNNATIVTRRTLRSNAR